MAFMSHLFCKLFLKRPILKGRAFRPSTEEWINKMWYIFTVGYYSATKRDKTGSLAEMRMDWGTVIQSEVSQKNKYHILMHMIESRKMI